MSAKNRGFCSKFLWPMTLAAAANEAVAAAATAVAAANSQMGQAIKLGQRHG